MHTHTHRCPHTHMCTIHNLQTELKQIVNGGLQQFMHLIRQAVDCKNVGGIFMTPYICTNYMYYSFQTSVAEDVTPVTAYDKNGLKSVIYFSSNRPRPDVLVMVLSTLSTNTKPVKNFMFQAAVPKVRRGCLFFLT